MTMHFSAIPHANLSHLTWDWKAFSTLVAHEDYTMLKVRSDVFVVEQNCAYSDIDNLDINAWHLFAWDGSALAAYLRVLPPDAHDSDIRIGRVLTSPHHRGIRLGHALLERSMQHIAAQWADVPMRLHAQAHLQKFYGAFGFKAISDVHDEDGIPHVWMRSE